jgi:hypothetical protein
MSWFNRLRNSFGKQNLEDRLDDELQFHIQMRTEEFMAAGMSAEEARLNAVRLFGNQTFLKEQTRDMDTITWLETFLQDLRYGLRMLCRSPGFTAVAVLSLALGIGANITVFSLFDTVLVRMLPVHNPHQLFVLYETGPHETDRANVSYPQFLRFHHDLAGTGELLALTDPARFSVVMPTGIIESAEAQLVSG